VGPNMATGCPPKTCPQVHQGPDRAACAPPPTASSRLRCRHAESISAWAPPRRPQFPYAGATCGCATQSRQPGAKFLVRPTPFPTSPTSQFPYCAERAPPFVHGTANPGRPQCLCWLTGKQARPIPPNTRWRLAAGNPNVLWLCGTTASTHAYAVMDYSAPGHRKIEARRPSRRSDLLIGPFPSRSFPPQGPTPMNYLGRFPSIRETTTLNHHACGPTRRSGGYPSDFPGNIRLSTMEQQIQGSWTATTAGARAGTCTCALNCDGQGPQPIALSQVQRTDRPAYAIACARDDHSGGGSITLFAPDIEWCAARKWLIGDTRPTMLGRTSNPKPDQVHGFDHQHLRR